MPTIVLRATTTTDREARRILRCGGEQSFNDGAGLSGNDKLAAWLKVAMPLGDPILTEQESLDIAAFVNSKPRPKFVLQDHLPKPERLGEHNSER